MRVASSRYTAIRSSGRETLHEMMIWSLRRPDWMRELGRLQGREDHALVDDLFGSLAEIVVRVFLHLLHDELLVEGAAVDADAHGLRVVARDVADRRELLVAPRALADVAGVDAVLVERAGAVGVLRQQNVAVVVEVADERRQDPGVEHPLLDLRHGRGGLRDVDRDPHHVRARARELDALGRCRLDVHRVRVRHGLDDDRGAPTHLDGADLHSHGRVAFPLAHRHFNLPDARGSQLSARRATRSYVVRCVQLGFERWCPPRPLRNPLADRRGWDGGGLQGARHSGSSER